MMEEGSENMSPLQSGSPNEVFIHEVDEVVDFENPTPLVLDTLVTHVKHLYFSRHKAFEEIIQKQRTTARLKSTEEAAKIRTQGNRRYHGAHLSNAAYVYTKCIAFAPDGSEELARAYANRSAVFLRTHKLVECLLDVNRALEGNYPKNLRPKLEKRKRKCLNFMRASGQFGHYEGNETDPIDAANVDISDDEFRSFSNFGNPLIPRASPKIQLAFNERWGRHMVATEDIEPGEILSSDKLFVTGLQPLGMYRNCTYCLARCHALIPCSSCPQMYCSKKCLLRAKELYHGIECEVLKYISKPNAIDLEQTVLFRAQRTLFIGTKQGTELRNVMDKLEIRDIFAENVELQNEPLADDYFTVLRMCKTFNSNIMIANTPHILETIVALRHVGFFENANDGVADEEKPEQHQNFLSEMELFVVMLLMNHVNALAINQYGISQFTDSFSNNPFFEKTIAGGVFPIHNFINHSCDPNIQCFMRKRQRVIFASRPIRAGEQIFDTYCGTFADTPLRNRQSRLKSYAFTCLCRACLNEWPTTDILEQRELLSDIRDQNENEGDTTILRRYTGTVRNADRSSVVALKRDTDSALERNFPGGEFRNTIQSRRDILQTASEILEWIDANVERPSFITVMCEYELSLLMKFLFEESSKSTHPADPGKSFFDLVDLLNDYVFYLHAL